MNRASSFTMLAILAAGSAAEINAAATQGSNSCENGLSCPASVDLQDETALLQGTLKVHAAKAGPGPTPPQSGDQVTWKKSDKDVPSGTVGTVLEVTVDALGEKHCRVQFGQFTGSFDPEDLVKKASLLEMEAKEHESLSEEERSIFYANGTRRVPMDFIYFRHGQSTGNAKKFWRYGDGVLTETGQAQATRRVGFLNRAQLLQIVNSRLVAVSPLRRAMGTALIIMASAMKRCANNGGAPITEGWCANPPAMPRVTVYTTLREKYQSNSEAPNCGWKNAINYITEIHNGQRGGLTPNQATVLQHAATRMDASYQLAFAAATGKAWDNTCVTWHPLPEDGFQYSMMIRDFKDAVMAIPVTSMLIVAHSGWARYAFSSFLPDDATATTAADALIHAGRKIRPLNNCGVVQGELEAVAPVNRGVSGAASKFQNVVVDAVTPGDNDYTNTEAHGKFGIFVSDREAMDEHRMPPNSHSELLIMEKKMQGMTGSMTNPQGGFETRIITLGWSGHPNAGTLGWADEFGVPKHYCTLAQANQAVRVNPSGTIQQVEVTCSQGGQAKKVVLRPGRLWQFDGTHALNTMNALRDKINAFADPNNAPPGR